MRDMAYVSYTFLFFLVVTVTIYYIVPKSWQWMVLLIASIIFYACSGLGLLCFLVGASFITWSGAYGMSTLKKKNKENSPFVKMITILILIANAGMLLVLKWGGIGLAIVNSIAGTSLAIRFFLPLGISFFTFQNISYIIDVYKGKTKAETNFTYFLLYAMYFPYIVSGPINRYGKMRQQFFEIHVFQRRDFEAALLRILWGFLKKMVIADRAAIFVDEVFGNYYNYRGLFIVIATGLYMIQLYMDFSGCMDIVIGTSKLFGITMEENFRAPFAATSIADFWRRWHISLGAWFKEYVYIPLGGNRKGVFRKYINIVIVFLLCGMWHGAGVTYLIWGFVNGIYQIIGEVTKNFRNKACELMELSRDGLGQSLRKRIITIFLWGIPLLFFRADGVREAFGMFRRIFVGWNPWILTDGSLYQIGLDTLGFGIVFIGTLLVGAVSSLDERINVHEHFTKMNWTWRCIIIVMALIIWYLFGMYGPGFSAANFVYYNF